MVYQIAKEYGVDEVIIGQVAAALLYTGTMLKITMLHIPIQKYNRFMDITGLTWMRALTGKSIDNVSNVTNSGEIPDNLLYEKLLMQQLKNLLK